MNRGTRPAMSGRSILSLVLTAVMLVAPGARAHAQSSADPQQPATGTGDASTPSTPSAGTQAEPTDQPITGTVGDKDRIFGVLPNYNTVTASAKTEFSPITT